MVSGECSHSGQWTVDSGQSKVESGEWRVESGEWRVESGEWRVESGEWRVESVVLAGEEAPGERSPPNWGLTPQNFYLDWYLCRLTKLVFFKDMVS